jgi:hypothetical protein
MSFAHPHALLLLALLIPVGLLYWLRIRVPRRMVSTGLFWQEALAEEQVRWRWRRWRPQVSLAAQLLIVVLLALAAAGPQKPPAKRIVLVIDNSATMRATDVQPRRIDAAKETARRLIESLRTCDEMAVVRVCPTPLEVQPMTNDQALLKTAIGSVEGTADWPEIEWAVKVAREVSSPDKVPPRIVLITDACAEGATRRACQGGVEVLRVGTSAGNLAITRFNARRSQAEPAKCEVLVEVQNRGNKTAQGAVTITGAESSVPPVRFSVAQDDCWRHVFSLHVPSGAHLTAKIDPDDAYVFDDTAVLDVPAAPAAHRVKLVAEQRSGLKEILAANSRVDLIRDDAQEKAIQVIDGKTPATLPAGPALIFTPGLCDLWQLGAAVADPRVTRSESRSPIMAGVRLLDAYLPEARQLQIAESVRSAAQPIFWAEETPLGYAIDRPEGRVVVIAGNLATSNLAWQAGFPQLIAQSLDWLDGQLPWRDEIVGSYPAGERGEEARQASEPDGSSPAAVAAADVGGIAGLDSATYGRAECGGADIRVPSDIGDDASRLVLQRPWPPLWVAPAALAAMLLVFEWCLYQRRWTS